MFKQTTIAIIDSGIGGLSVLKALINKYGAGNYIYFADNLLMPYGDHKRSFIKTRVESIMEKLKNEYFADLIIIACNTASSCLNGEMENVLKLTFENNITYLTTPLTKRNLKNVNVIADKTLAKDIEDNILNGKKLKNMIKTHVERLRLCKYNQIILGCTHYELAVDLFKEICPEIEFVNNSTQIIDKIKIKAEELNVKIILSKPNKSYYEKILKILNKKKDG